MKRFEYHCATYSNTQDNPTRSANQLGAEGWELVIAHVHRNASAITMIVKREKTE